jgi:hypothetical protein
MIQVGEYYKFKSPYLQYKCFNDRQIKVIEIIEDEGDLHDEEVLPMYKIEIIDVDKIVIEAWPEEIHEGEHDPEKCGCKYLGNDTWSCGHIDNNQF